MSDIDSARTEDRVLGFALPARSVRGRLVRLGPVLNQVLAAHSYPPVIEKLVAEALVLAALLGAMLKDDEGQLTLQAQTEQGAVSLLVADYMGGAVRGYAQFDEERLAELGDSPTLFGLFGKGYLAITFDQAVTGERYQGIVPLEGAGLGAAAEHYFAQSEQIPSIVQIAVRHDADEGCVGGGMLLQHLPEGEVGRERLHVRHDHPDWEHVTIMGRTLSDNELTDPALALEDIIWRLFHEEEEIRALSSAMLTKGCRCDPDRIKSVLGRFDAAERTSMADERGVIAVDCAFCSRIFDVTLAELQQPH
ncbi:MAG: Hsp33 family molecular chaperone HslO [Alphaproteobacteria bacterium]|nr:Hsp33 family molecular chaperone HslO [Alphaproteobacteria bacterium]MBU0792983.1 Hsp33 family molecular chaperone HslO [Alphaproteobacteria bacterium]MBU0875151.1 Hsp33 family molecular chaperone HslO [Alphaproteobacteria bacterium]MBU1768900.1 Hsp33 family molecular chaperone HslO [Alphaproteobacteria bacterium]